MPAPAVVAIPWLASVLGAAFAGVVAWFAKFFTEKIALRVAVTAFLVGLIAALFLALKALIDSLTVVFPAEALGFIGLVIPTGAEYSVTVVASAAVLRWAFDWKVRMAELYAS